MITALDAPRTVKPFREVVAAVVAKMSEVRDRMSIAPADDSAASVTGSKVQLPQWLFMYLVAQLVAGVWWAASLQSDVRYLQAENAKLWQKVELVTLQQADTEKRMDERIRAKVRETMDDAGYLLRVRPKE